MSIERMTPYIVAADPAERSNVLATIVEAFESDPACRAFWPELVAFRQHFPRFVELFGGPAQADRIVDGVGAALWPAPGVEADPEPLMAHLEATLPENRKGALLAGLEVQGSRHPHEPYWYLPFIGVRAATQAQGIGAAILAHGLARADRDGRPVYLEATSWRSVPLYQRFGFETIGVVESPGYSEIFAM